MARAGDKNGLFLRLLFCPKCDKIKARNRCGLSLKTKTATGMSLKLYLWLMGLASLLAMISFLAILWFFSPQNANVTILALLFLCLFIALCGFFSLLGFYIRRRRNKAQAASYFFGISLREGTLLSLLLVGFLLMRAAKIFSWWLALIFLIIIVAIEVVFIRQEEGE